MKIQKIRSVLVMVALVALFTGKANAQDQQEQQPPQKSLQVYGFAMVDMGYNFKQIDPKWFDAMRITRLPKYKNQFAPDGTFFFGVRQTRFGVAGYTPTNNYASALCLRTIGKVSCRSSHFTFYG